MQEKEEARAKAAKNAIKEYEKSRQKCVLYLGLIAR